MQKYNGQLINQFPNSINGNAAAGAKVTVKLKSTGTTATLYATDNIGGATVANPVTADSRGYYGFYAPDGVYTLDVNISGTPQLEIQLQDVADLQAQFDEALANAGFVPVGTFAAGCTVSQSNGVVSDGSSFWRWDGALPKTVTAGSSPTPTGVGGWLLVSDSGIRGDISSGNIIYKSLGGSASTPAYSFGTDTDTGIYLKGSNSLSLATGGTERVTLTSLGRLGIAKESPAAKLHVEVQNDVTSGIRSTCYWEGSTATPYQNNDCTLFETRNKVLSNSTNYSWSVSADNGENDIPAGVTDLGFRKGVYGWAVSKHNASYQHHGVLSLQMGVHGLAGFLGAGNAATGTVTEAIGVRGEINHDASAATIVNAVAGEFISVASTGSVQNNYAVRAVAQNGDNFNYSFHGDAGNLFNEDKALFGSKFTQLNSKVSARGVGNTYEFGFASTGGYESAVGVMPSSGAPFIGFCTSVSTSTDTFNTTGQVGFVIHNQLDADSLLFSAVRNPSATGQSLTESFRIDQNDRVQFQKTPILPAFAPASASATGQTGQVSWDANYIYVCTGANTWKRAALATW